MKTVRSKGVADTHSREAMFSFGELFFSHTDTRGVILAGNSVFQRISEYDWSELLNSPHKIIRHPDTPKAVFYLLWDYLKAGKPIGAYVKNRTKTGAYYWVFALAMPTEDGYLSVRLKPSSDLFHKVIDLYAEHVEHERVTGGTSEASAGVLLQAIKTLGFQSYDDFMSEAIACEVLARDAAVGHREDAVLKLFQTLLKTSKVLVSTADAISVTYETYRHVPLNLRVLASQLGADGSAIGVISGDYGGVSAEISEGVAGLGSVVVRLMDEIRLGSFLMAAARLQADVVAFFRSEADDRTGTQANEMDHLTRLMLKHRANASEGLASIRHEVRQFEASCSSLSRLRLGLEVIRVMAKLNSASIGTENPTLIGLIGDLDTFQAAISTTIDQLQRMCRDLIGDLDKIIWHISDAGRRNQSDSGRLSA